MHKPSTYKRYALRQLDREEPRDATYSPEKHVDNYGHKPVRHWQAFSLARLESPSNFDAD